MRPAEVERDRLLDALYAELPTIACQGLCERSCGPIPLTTHERARVRRALHRQITCEPPDYNCSALVAKRCSVYATRPMICRLWGLVEGMRCPWGCVPERVLTDAEGARYLARASQIGGRVRFTLGESLTPEEFALAIEEAGSR
jgi:uncharacterized protein